MLSPATTRSLVPVAVLFTSLCSVQDVVGQSWTNLGHGKTGSLGTPVLVGTRPQLGASVSLSLLGARRSAPAFLVVGDRRVDVPFLGGTLVPAPIAVFPGRTDNLGRLVTTFRVPNDPKLIVLRPVVQQIVADPLATSGAAFSNALEGRFCLEFATVEDFRSVASLDVDRSAGTWGNGSVRFGLIGGDGRHGDFDASIGTVIRANPPIYEWNLDQAGGFRIPKSLTMTGKDELVTDGRFAFQNLTVPAGTKVRFVGSKAARISVRGTVDIRGELVANGAHIPATAFNKTSAKGEPGGRGGAMGGRGGAGGDKGDGTGHKVAFDGRHGADVVLPSGHAYARNATRTGGRGSVQFPVDGRDASIVFSYFAVISQQSNRGGGGGGFTGRGGAGLVRWRAPRQANQKYAATGTTVGGNGFTFPSLFPNYTNGFTHQDHFLAGGSGGGGGGSACGGAIKSVRASWWTAGRGGAGGGGALGLRIGGRLRIGPAGSIHADGGSCAYDTAVFSTRNMATPGGGGSGGSVFIQVAGRTDNQNEITAKGGQGGRVFGSPGDQVYGYMESYGGDGSNGIVHFETESPTNYPVGKTIPKAPVSKLDPKFADRRVGVRSKWYLTSLAFPKPGFLRYEIETTVDGKPVTFSDDPRVGRLASGAPLRFLVQGAVVYRDPTGQVVPLPSQAIRPWRTFVGPHGKDPLFADGVNGYRFELLLDRSAGQRVVVKKVTVRWCL